MKLAAKLILISIICVIAVLSVSYYFTTQRAWKRLRHENELRAQQLTSKMEKPIRDALIGGDMEAMKRHLAMPVARLVYFDEQVTEETKPYASGDFSQLVSNKQMRTVISRQRRQLHVYCPLELEGRSAGLEFTTALAELDREARDEFFDSLIAVAAMSLLSIGVALIAGVRLVARPLEQLTDATKRMGQGDFSQRVSVSGNDELSQLGRAINEMSEKLQKQKQTIENETHQKIEAFKQLRHADRLKTVGRMAAVIAHELGTPLSVVSGRASLIASGNLSDEKVKHNATSIKTETERISEKIRQLLDFSRQDPMEKSRVDLHAVVTQSFDLIRSLAEKQKIDVRMSLTDEQAFARGNTSQIQQVLTNIMMNAIQSMPNGGKMQISTARHQASFQSAKPEEYWVVAIEDHGTGISPDDLEKIFEPFYTTKDVGQGTGLGLSIAYNIVQEHQGWIDVESKPGKGSCFSVYLPVGE